MVTAGNGLEKELSPSTWFRRRGENGAINAWKAAAAAAIADILQLQLILFVLNCPIEPQKSVCDKDLRIFIIQLGLHRVFGKEQGEKIDRFLPHTILINQHLNR